jgi:hypothetical protein
MGGGGSSLREIEAKPTLVNIIPNNNKGLINETFKGGKGGGKLSSIFLLLLIPLFLLYFISNRKMI